MWGNKVEVERNNRIKLAMAAYAYEIDNHSIMSDSEYDKLSLKIRPEIDTGDEVLDPFFREKFEPDTGQWIHDYPKERLEKLSVIYRAVYGRK